MDESVRIEVSADGIATITLNRPEKRNALSIALRDTLTETLREWHEDASVRVVVLSGGIEGTS